MSYEDLHIIIAAGGIGRRMQSEVPKQFIDVKDKDILSHTISALSQAAPSTHLVIVMPASHIGRSAHYRESFPDMDMDFVQGGDTRFASSRAGLSICPDSGVVMVHDAARPLVSPALIRRLYERASTMGSAVPVVPIKSSLRKVKNDHSEYADRGQYRLVQTPQAFRADWIHEAYRTEYRPEFTDDARVVEYAGHDIHLVEGDEQNIKITTPLDLHIFEYLLQSHS